MRKPWKEFYQTTPGNCYGFKNYQNFDCSLMTEITVLFITVFGTLSLPIVAMWHCSRWCSGREYRSSGCWSLCSRWCSGREYRLSGCWSLCSSSPCTSATDAASAKPKSRLRASNGRSEYSLFFPGKSPGSCTEIYLSIIYFLTSIDIF